MGGTKVAQYSSLKICSFSYGFLACSEAFYIHRSSEVMRTTRNMLLLVRFCGYIGLYVYVFSLDTGTDVGEDMQVMSRLEPGTAV